MMRRRVPLKGDRSMFSADVFPAKQVIPPKNGPVLSRAGFSLVEIMLVGGLMVFLGVLLSSAWRGIGRSAADAAARSQLLQELDLAAAALSRDLGGSQFIPSTSTPGEYGGKDAGRLVYCRPGTLNEFGDLLELQYENESDPGSPIVVRYYLADDPDEDVPTKILVRSNDADATAFTVARCVKTGGFSVEHVGDWTVIQLTFEYSVRHATYTRKCTLNARYLPE